MERPENVMILYDGEEEYAQLFGEYLRGHRECPWALRIYTDKEELLERERGGHPILLVVAESSYEEGLKCLHAERTVLLNESGRCADETIIHVNKYQGADAVLRELLEVYLEVVKEEVPGLLTGTSTRVLGMYSPVKRCCQTTFALTMSQLLAAEHATLYLNFEPHVGMQELLPRGQERDLSDLLYFLGGEADKFPFRLQTVVQRIDRLDYVPPMRAGQNLLSVAAEDWLRLLRRITGLGSYEYVVLDLSDSMQGLFDILRMCHKVFTLTLEDRVAQCKILQYEQMLELQEYEDVTEKTRKCAPPKIKRLPEEVIRYTRGEMADYVRREMMGQEQWEGEC